MGASQSSLDNEKTFCGIKRVQEVKFYLHGKEHIVTSENITPNMSLNSYLRNIQNMYGTKGMCFEGGCGACVVVLQSKDPITNKDIYLAVNSCLTPLLSCNGWNIFTIEGIGNSLKGYHLIQKVLAKFNGTQCGFCSPGMVMNMYALYESGKLTMKDVEDSFSGNLCRCTGYRSILSAFKSLCADATPEIVGECPDIEDFARCYKEKCANKCTNCPNVAHEAFLLDFFDSHWIKVHTIKDIIILLNTNSTSYRLVAGNTAQGVYPSYKEKVLLYIDITAVPELQARSAQNDVCVLGANNTLTNTIEFFYEVAKKFTGFAYLEAVADHISLVANVPVRNRGTIAGNLMIKHDHHDFPSDIFLVLETVGAILTIVDIDGTEIQLSPQSFINYDMKATPALLKTVTLKSFPDTAKYISYKIMPRAQNVHALVNAGFLFQLDSNNVVQNATIIYGNINFEFVHAAATESLLKGKHLFDNSFLAQVYTSLASEIKPDVRPPDPRPKFRQQLSISLFYKAVLSIAPVGKISSRNKSGGQVLQRPISTGAQDYQTNESLYPLTEDIPKIEALPQTAGIAQYVIDLPDLPYQLHGALVLAEAPPNSEIKTINPNKALSIDGVTAFFTKNDIPGDNVFTPIINGITSREEIFCDGTVKFYDQPLGIIVGTNREVVNEASKLVEVTYVLPDTELLLTSRQILQQGRKDRIRYYKTLQPSRKGNDVKHVIKGTVDLYHQYHFHMETHCCQVVPNEDGLVVYSSTQWMDVIQIAIAKMLNIPQHRVEVIVRRCGGAFGAKITRATLIACAAALVAWKLKKTCKRYPFSADYEVGVNDSGVIQYLKSSLYRDTGYQFDEDTTFLLEGMLKTMYMSETFLIDINYTLTDTHVNTWMRGPGSIEGFGFLESIMDHIAYTINADPLQVRLLNLSDRTPVARYFSELKTWADIDNRKSAILTFNKENRWKKKGIAVNAFSFDMNPMGPYLSTVSILHSDGSVQISHSGVELGQGINTKAAQVCAFKFSIPLEKVRVLPSNSFVSANSNTTAASLTSDAICYGVAQACDELLARISPYRTNGAKWEDVINQCQKNFVKLTATGIYSPKEPNVKKYSVYASCAVEVEVDILTGQHLVNRVDLIEDTGISLSPKIDIGQIEGAFIMGLGYFTTEKIVFNYEGKILTNNTWTYYVPGAKDIPVKFNVKLPKNNPNPVGVLQSKGTGEPAICFGFTVALAIRNALASARVDASASNSKWYPVDGVTDVENAFMNSLNDPSQYIL
ncbi:hypothetical protein Zmor_003190 [Zophobas morio]|uniref:FAD-binding PCMH-type domain-containing protein n=1 Tax=Zophobas morio TaxID=2755281 RepID=A0AA38HL18_9CUCU|nr:hypothetical protein Zmor_003190 [Zophobas morio]